MEQLSPVQQQIFQAIKQMSERANFTEFQVAKKIRENIKLDGKKKAGLALNDLLAALKALEDEGIFYSVHVNSVNECLLRKEEKATELALESKQRRQKSEKSMIIFTNGDLKSAGQNNNKKSSQNKRNERKKLSIYDSFDD